MKIVRNISRILLGLVFMFSGFVKGVDPWGFTYKLIDYFEAFQLEWLEPSAIFLSVFVSALEFVIGFMLFLNARPKLASWGNLLFMAFFTPLTLYLAIENPVNDCGCFGDAIILTNWETFYKNLILLALSILVFIERGKFKPSWKSLHQTIIIFVGFFIMFGFSWYSYQHLPIIDFRAWKVGSDMTQKPPKPRVFLTYKNTETGETKEWLTKDLPYKKPGFNEQWQFVSQRVVEPDMPDNTLRLENKDGINVSEDILNVEGYNFILVAYNLEKADAESMVEMDHFHEQCQQDSIGFQAITGSLFNTISSYKKANNLDYPFYLADDIALKTVIRSNPGLLLLKDGVIQEKWHYNDFPDYKQFRKEYLK